MTKLLVAMDFAVLIKAKELLFSAAGSLVVGALGH
jgi:hypothetical protein